MAVRHRSNLLVEGAITGAITEFPYFTGLYADLHAHVVAWPITILAIAAYAERK